ncbi:alkaline phosphatase family protein [Fimbriimonas ginsengisoli]|uniref:alkaline phosphatase family protein n=1 Tax=Fimbriimonas ginsengisoli TaxID=1005039 RepID=UPI001D0EF822|nr:alkaline phosphatase family protein [Fimbriimonas ginsengisoli]
MPPTVLLVSIDGMRPDALRSANTPYLDRLVANGTVCWNARTVMPSVTLPCHTSMLRGVDVPRHGITSNRFSPLARPVPSVIDVAKTHGRRTGFFFNWGELRDLAEPGSFDVSYFVQDAHRMEGDTRVAKAAAAHQREEPFDFLFVYLGHVDERGHAEGWMSPGYIEAIEHADACVGMVLAALDEGDRSWVALIQSDHGGHERSHGTEMDEDMTIPWILSGHGVKAGNTLDGGVRIYDTCPTLAHLLGLPAAREWDGRIVGEALDL